MNILKNSQNVFSGALRWLILQVLLLNFQVAEPDSKVFGEDSQNNRSAASDHSAMAVTRKGSDQLALEEYICFSDESKARNRSNDYKTKAWTEPERKIVLKLLERIKTTAPGLLILATAERKVLLARAGKMHLPTEILGATEEAAVWNGEEIVLSDGFFERGYEFRELIHEFVHAADAGYRLSYSKEWVNFAQDTILRLRLISDLTTPTKYARLEKSTRSQDSWPSLYGCRSLIESLPEYFAAYEEKGDFIPDPWFADKMANRLVQPTEKDVAWSKTFTAGRIAFEKGEYAKAASLMRDATSEDPLTPFPRIYQARICLKNEDYVNCVAESNKALDCFTTAGVKPPDDNLRRTKLLLASSLLQSKDYSGARKVLDKCLTEFPTESAAFWWRSQCEEELGEFGKSLYDIFIATRLQRHVFKPRITDVTTDPKLVEKYLSETVATTINVDNALRSRAEYYEMLGDGCEDPKLAKMYFSSALKDIASTAGSKPSPRYYTSAARLSFKLELFENARSLALKAINLDEKSLEAKIIIFSLNEKFGGTNASTEFARLKQNIFS